MSSNGEDLNQQLSDEKITYVDLEMLEYEDNVLLFLRKKLDSFAVDVLRMIRNEHKKDGLNKTSIDNYAEHRKRYDAAILVLEGQGFIENRPVGTSKPYFLTVRGLQLIQLLIKERAREKELELGQQQFER